MGIKFIKQVPHFVVVKFEPSDFSGKQIRNQREECETISHSDVSDIGNKN